MAVAVMVQCWKCKQNIEVPVTEEQLQNWRAGELSQRAMPNLTPDQRELLISGLCGSCFDKMYSPEVD